MTASFLSLCRCEPPDILPTLSPGQVTGLYDGSQWIDWGGEACPDLEVVAASRIDQLARIDSRRFHCVLDLNGACPGPTLSYLMGRSRGIALVSSRAGFLLRWAPRLLTPACAIHEQVSGAFRRRSSGARLISGAAALRALDRSDVVRSTMLSVGLKEPAAAVGVLESSFPALQVDSTAIHLPLQGHHAEEVLCRLREEGIRVTASAVWYRLLQSCPLK